MGVSKGQPEIFSWYVRGHMLFSYFAGFLIDTRYVNLGDELHDGWLVWVFGTTVDVDAVDAVLVCALIKVSLRLGKAYGIQTYVRRTEDSAVPIAHHKVVTISKAIGASL